MPATKGGKGTTHHIRGYGLTSSDSEQAKIYYHYVSDEKGSITHLISSEEERVLNEYSYDVFGNRTVLKETVDNLFGYTGQQYDGITGQYYLRARYYNPVIGRFIQEDTYYGDGLNLYAYCCNNPVMYYDPTGHEHEAHHNPNGGNGADGPDGGSNPRRTSGGADSGSDKPEANGNKPKASNDGTDPSNNKPKSETPDNNPSQNGTSDPKNNSKRQTPDQQALRELAKEAANRAKQGNPISEEEARILDEWAQEYNVPQHHQAYKGSGEHFPGGNYSDHTHIYNIHVPYKSENN